MHYVRPQKFDRKFHYYPNQQWKTDGTDCLPTCHRRVNIGNVTVLAGIISTFLHLGAKRPSATSDGPFFMPFTSYTFPFFYNNFGYNLNYMSLKQEYAPKRVLKSFGYNLNYMSLKPQIEAKLPG